MDINHLDWETQKTYLVEGTAEPRGKTSLTARSSQTASTIRKPPSGICCSPLHHFFTRHRELWSDGLRDLISSPSSAKDKKILPGSFTKEEKRLGGFQCPVCQSQESLWTVSPVLLFGLISALTQTLPGGLFHLWAPRSHLLLLTRSLSLAPSLPLLAIFPSQTFSQSLPAFLLSCPPLSSSSSCSLLHSLQTRLLVYSLPARLGISLLPHPPLQLSFTHYFTFTRCGTPSATHMLPTTAQHAHALDTY